MKISNKKTDMHYNKKLIKTLQRPVHITYISEIFYSKDMDSAMKDIQDLINQGIVEESKYGKGYYVLTSK